MKSIQDIINEAHEIIAQELDEQVEPPTSLYFLLNNIPAWKRWYLKKNQPNNYFRVTQIIPPGFIECPYFWVCKFQVWTKKKVLMEFSIEPSTFLHFYEHHEWAKQEVEGMSSAILRNRS